MKGSKGERMNERKYRWKVKGFLNRLKKGSIGEMWKDEWKEVKVHDERMNERQYMWKVKGEWMDEKKEEW